MRLVEKARRRPSIPLGRWTGSGFVGTVLGLAGFMLLPEAPRPLAAALALGCAVAVWAAHGAERALGGHDDPRIVVDEIVGFWVAGALLPRSLPYMASAFLLFRLFDSFKLPPYSWLERLPGGWGVVMDDLGAGLAANLCVRGLSPWLAP